MTQPTIFTPPTPLKTAVLFMVFNRPDTTAQVFEAIRKAKPPRLYVAADGPRPDREGEVEKVSKVREIATAVDWPCEVKILFRDKNLGCKYAVSGAITWFFENEEQGIILEDDCLPSQSFFWFCETLLIQYKYDNRIGQVCGFNPIKLSSQNNSYFYSRFGPIWGWASWRRSWANYDVHMLSWPIIREKRLLDAVVASQAEYNWRIKLFDNLYYGGIDTWDYQWSFSKMINSQLNVIPVNNMIINIGFGDDATHTKKQNKKYLDAQETSHIEHPIGFMANKVFDDLYLDEFARIKGGRIKGVIKKMIDMLTFRNKKKIGTSNNVIDNCCNPVLFNDLAVMNIRKVSIESRVVNEWLSQGGLSEFIKINFIHKKGLEFFLTSYLIEPKANESILDAAGGHSLYLKALSLNGHKGEIYLTDHIFEGVTKRADGVNIVGGDITRISLPDNSVDKITCHHAFEHFQENKDIEFIVESYRILKPNGLCVITPIFIADQYLECWNIFHETKFDTKANLIIDESASLPGGHADGHFARIYDTNAFAERVVNQAKKLGFVCELIELEIDGMPMPDMRRNFGSKINQPLRALALRKSGNG